MMRRPASAQPMLEHFGIRGMRLLHLFIAAAFVSPVAPLSAQAPAAPKHFISEDSPVLVLNPVRVIDGTGAMPAEGQRIDIEGGKILRVQSATLKNAYPRNTKISGLSAKTLIPGLVGMHEHLFYATPERTSLPCIPLFLYAPC
jgi:hypothetical protein